MTSADVCTPGRRALLSLLQTTTQAAVAALVGVDPSCVSYWSSGRSRPGPRARRILSEAYGIAPDSWGALPAQWERRERYRSIVT